MTALGGEGYMEENGICRLVRDGIVEKIWEVMTTVLSLDMVRTSKLVGWLGRSPGQVGPRDSGPEVYLTSRFSVGQRCSFTREGGYMQGKLGGADEILASALDTLPASLSYPRWSP